MNKLELNLTEDQYNQWINHLESDKFIQGTDVLCMHKDDPENEEGKTKYCCIGVLGTQFTSDDTMIYCDFLESKDHSITIDQSVQELLSNMNDFGFSSNHTLGYLNKVFDEGSIQYIKAEKLLTSNEIEEGFKGIAQFLKEFFTYKH